MSANYYGSSIQTGGIGYSPQQVSLNAPRTAQQQMFNRPAYQRNRVTGAQFGEMNLANQDRYRAEVMPLQNAFNRSLQQANQRQQMESTSAANQLSNQFFNSTNNYANQSRDMNTQFLWPLLSRAFQGF